MNLLIIDTSTEWLLAGLNTPKGLDSLHLDGPMNHSSQLAPAVESLLLRNPGIIPEAIICQGGPGSFTGLRIGFSAAKGYSEGWGIPLIGVSSLDAMAWMHRDNSPFLFPAIDARKGRFYGALYSQEGKRVGEYLDRAPVDFLPDFEGKSILFCGYQGIHLAKILQDKGIWEESWTIVSPLPWLEGMKELGLDNLKLGKVVEPAQGPFYLRESDAIPPAAREASDQY